MQYVYVKLESFQKLNATHARSVQHHVQFGQFFHDHIDGCASLYHMLIKVYSESACLVFEILHRLQIFRLYNYTSISIHYSLQTLDKESVT